MIDAAIWRLGNEHIVIRLWGNEHRLSLCDWAEFCGLVAAIAKGEASAESEAYRDLSRARPAVTIDLKELGLI